MGKKILLNVLINIGIITLILCAVWAFNHQYYYYLAGALAILALLLMLKIRLIKSVRKLTKR